MAEQQVTVIRETLYICNGGGDVHVPCGASVPASGRELHLAFHQRLDRLEGQLEALSVAPVEFEGELVADVGGVPVEPWTPADFDEELALESERPAENEPPAENVPAARAEDIFGRRRGL